MSNKPIPSDLHCMKGLLQLATGQAPDRFAFIGPDREGLTYAQLVAHVTSTVRKLNSVGLTRSSRIGLSMPNGPELAIATISIMCGMAVVPLNPDYTLEEYRYHLAHARVDAVLVQQGIDSPLRLAAQELNVPVFNVVPEHGGAVGLFDLEGVTETDREPIFCEPDDVAQILFTSGTTAQPKYVAKLQRGVFQAVYPFSVVAEGLGLTEGEILVNMLPLFHGFGISTLIGGVALKATLLCTPHFAIRDFYQYLDQYKIKIFWALPAMLQAIIEEAPNYEEILSTSSLRYFISSSAPLSPSVIEGAAQSFKVIIMQFYGLTETNSVAWRSPHIPGLYKAGSVGKLTGDVETVIMDEDRTVLPNGMVGEIAVRGPNVITHYEDNPEADALAFIDGWFHTGDIGYLDNENFLFITGRIKEVINRGGEKVSPNEIDNVLLQHPAVAHAAAFGIRHDVLGEDVAAAVVLKANATATERDLRQFLTQRLALQKVPSRIFIVEHLPMTGSGKIRRLSLAQHVGLVPLTH